MTAFRYCTPEWLEESARLYRETPALKKRLEPVTTNIVFRVTADAAWGLEEDVLFGASVEKGELLELRFFDEDDARESAEFILAATPQAWKKVLRKDAKFVAEFMLGRIVLEQGTVVGVLGLAPHATTFVDALTQVDLRFPDELAPEELEAYRADVAAFRTQLGL
ncbi:MAG: hypothetical protein PVH41_12895 [Anaerolineae bacterium]|jgi:hypothetical protein